MSKKVQKPLKGQQGVGRSFEHAYQGMVSAVRTQRNMRFHVFVAPVVLVGGLLLGVSSIELSVLVLTILVVFVTEMFNTALEFTVDLVTSEYRPLAKLAKDVSAGAVLVSSIGAVVVGCLILADGVGSLSLTVLNTIERGPGQLTLVSLGVVALVVVIGKALIRPSGALSGGIPSGHAAVASAGWVAASFIAAGGRYAGLVSLITLLMALLVCQSRIESGARSLFQVATGGMLGALVSVAAFQLL